MDRETYNAIADKIAALPADVKETVAYEACYPDRVPVEVFRMVVECLRLPGFERILRDVAQAAPEDQQLPPRALYEKLYPDAVSFGMFRDVWHSERAAKRPQAVGASRSEIHKAETDRPAARSTK